MPEGKRLKLGTVQEEGGKLEVSNAEKGGELGNFSLISSKPRHTVGLLKSQILNYPIGYFIEMSR